jgi:hypothetical protein
MMTVFEYSFTLIGLVLGLSLTEVLGGLLRTARSRGVRSLGILTPLLGTFVVVDAAATWGFVYGIRSSFGESVWPVLGFGVVLSSLYYCAAFLVFPDSEERWPDLDEYYMQHRRLVLGLLFLCAAVATAIASWRLQSFAGDIVQVSYLIGMGVTIWAPWKWANIVGLSGLIAVNVWAFFPPS